MGDNKVTRIAAVSLAVLVVVGLVGVGGSALTLATNESAEQETTTEAQETTTEVQETTAEAQETTEVRETTAETDEQTTVADGGESANVRVAHMSPDAPAVNVQLDNETVVQGADFSDVTEYLSVEPGDHRITITAADDESQVVFDEQLSFEAGTNYTVTAAGEVSENGTQEFSPLVLTDAAEAPAGENASIRLVHVSPDAGPVDVTLNQTGDVLFDNATFGNETEYATVPSGVYTLNVRQAAEDNNGTIVESFNVSLVNETAYTAFAAGYVAPEDAPANTSFDLFTAVDVTNNPDDLVVGTTAPGDGETGADDETETDEETEVEDETTQTVEETEEADEETTEAVEPTTVGSDEGEETTTEA